MNPFDDADVNGQLEVDLTFEELAPLLHGEHHDGALHVPQPFTALPGELLELKLGDNIIGRYRIDHVETRWNYGRSIRFHVTLKKADDHA